MTRRNTSIEVRPLSAATGAEIHGVDLSQPLPEPAYLEIRNALNDYGVIFFRDQDITPAQHFAFAERFGGAHKTRAKHTTALGDYPISEVRKEPGETRNIGGNWHTDNSFVPAPPLGSILVARQVPDHGGDTLFASMAAAYDALSDGLKKTLEGMRALHAKWHGYESDQPDRRLSAERRAELRAELADAEAIHPVVIRHPESGRKILYVNPTYTVRFDGWTVEESRPLLDYLYQHAVRPENVCRFRWREGSIAFWDNRSTWHYALNDYHGSLRLMHRIAVKGTPLTF
jgi:taurine dioxygenase